MSFQVIDADERQSSCEADSFGGIDTGEQGASQSGSKRDSDGVQFSPCDLGLRHSAGDDGDDTQSVLPGSDLRHDTAVTGVDVHL